MFLNHWVGALHVGILSSFWCGPDDLTGSRCVNDLGRYTWRSVSLENGHTHTTC